MTPARRGEVRAMRDGRKVLVVSADAVGEAGWPWCAPIVRRVGVPTELAVFAVTTHETDPVTGVVLLLETAPVPVEILGEPVGTMVGRTMVRIEDGIRTV